MIDGQRAIRDVLAESMRRERLGPTRPSWSDWCSFDNDGGPEEWRRRADHLIRLLAENGLSVSRTGDDAERLPPPKSNVIYRVKLHGRQTERMIRKADGNDWHIVVTENNLERVEQKFTVQQALLNGGLVLLDHPDAKTVPGLGRQLAALNEIYRVGAEAVEFVP